MFDYGDCQREENGLHTLEGSEVAVAYTMLAMSEGGMDYWWWYVHKHGYRSTLLDKE